VRNDVVDFSREPSAFISGRFECKQVLGFPQLRDEAHNLLTGDARASQ
jgi:hypothetical protein